MFDADTFMNLIGWSRYIDALLNSANGGEDWSFADLFFNTLPCVLQMFFIIWLLNWLLGMIADTVRCAGRGGRL